MTLNTIRALLGIVGGFSTAYAIAALIPAAGLTVRDFGVAVAICAACVIGIGLIRAVQSDRERMRAYRAAVWQRRIAEAPPHLTIIKGDLKPWPVGDDEVRR